jgi:hypothetical protein
LILDEERNVFDAALQFKLDALKRLIRRLLNYEVKNASIKTALSANNTARAR